ncbi:hypothetical protein KMW28_14470 [Flammeovirga yaeyamensis]|uniref:Lipoprotein n=1 Tax=Flammeovirga yaeyamensis TaxID=367791 RepID=A0AAX1N0K6_9BACT|nr:hypothetical protein [Flammeovirga yaeyamensis]MBB3700204.1 uncharacterized protein YcfL [Flammeovirga yaeyamensis]NMF37166.1 hypothetical protein [Flammeovirga yaeyamensis]QWG00857.1 hypothetical protein KMW28_14470 [Flammeovirga yaeyamensis]
MKHLALLILFTLLSCGQHKEIYIDPNKPKFETLDQGRMFFKNVRAPYYDLIKVPQATDDMIVYQIGKAVQDTTKAIIQLHIVFHETTQNAYIMLSPNQTFDGYMHYKVKWTDDTGLWNEIRYQQGSMNEQFKFATEIYNTLKKDNIKYEISFGDKTLPFLTTEEEREAFRITLVDYYRLVALF